MKRLCDSKTFARISVTLSADEFLAANRSSLSTVVGFEWHTPKMSAFFHAFPIFKALFIYNHIQFTNSTGLRHTLEFNYWESVTKWMITSKNMFYNDQPRINNFWIFKKKIIHHQSKLFSKFLEKNEKSNNIKNILK